MHDLGCKLGGRIDAAAHRGSALGKLAQPHQGVLDTLYAVLDLLGPGLDLLPQGDRHGIHQVGAAGLDLRLVLRCFLAHHPGKVHQCRLEDLLGLQACADMDGGGNDVIGTLAHVDMVIRMHGPVGEGTGQPGDHFVDVHVGAGARPGLEHVHREVRIVLSVGHRQARLANGRFRVLVQQTQFGVGTGTCGLDQAKRMDERIWKCQPADREIFHGPLRLCAVQGIRRHIELTHAVFFSTKL